MRDRRYQLRKDAVAIVERGHPWIFREQLSTAAAVFADGDRLRLVDGTNRIVGYGIYEAEGAIAIRIVRRGPAAPDAAWVRERIAAALTRRASLEARTDGIRLLNGESDELPAVVIDRFGEVLVVASYTAGADALARYAARVLRAELPAIRHVLLRPARRRQGSPQPARTLAGHPPAIAHFTEDGLAYAVDLAAGQKTGAYLDLRGLRRALHDLPLAGARVLNLFAYTGMLGRAAEHAGAAAITHVDASGAALSFAAAHHAAEPARHAYVEADIFSWLPAHDGAYELVIVDPPAMTSVKARVPAALAAYRKLYAAAAPRVAPGGWLVAACCTSRIERPVFRRLVTTALGDGFVLDRELAPEPDHPATFAQADYLKVLLFRRR